jgi:hypothetical protein
MTASDAPRPRRRVFWADLRFFVGIALIALSVAGVWFVVDAAATTSPVFAASRTLVPGDPVTAADLTAVDAALGAAGEAYLGAEQLQPGSVATRSIREGELVPRSALAPAAEVKVTTVVVSSATPVPSGVGPGAAVELWAAAADADGVLQTPSILVADATVARVRESGSMVGSGGTDVEIVIPRADVAATLEALSAGAALSLVPAAVTG